MKSWLINFLAKFIGISILLVIIVPILIWEDISNWKEKRNEMHAV